MAAVLAVVVIVASMFSAEVEASKLTKADKLGVEVIDQSVIWKQLIAAGITESRSLANGPIDVPHIPEPGGTPPMRADTASGVGDTRDTWSRLDNLPSVGMNDLYT